MSYIKNCVVVGEYEIQLKLKDYTELVAGMVVGSVEPDPSDGYTLKVVSALRERGVERPSQVIKFLPKIAHKRTNATFGTWLVVDLSDLAVFEGRVGDALEISRARGYYKFEGGERDSVGYSKSKETRLPLDKAFIITERDYYMVLRVLSELFDRLRNAGIKAFTVVDGRGSEINLQIPALGDKEWQSGYDLVFKDVLGAKRILSLFNIDMVKSYVWEGDFVEKDEVSAVDRRSLHKYFVARIKSLKAGDVKTFATNAGIGVDHLKNNDARVEFIIGSFSRMKSDDDYDRLEKLMRSQPEFFPDIDEAVDRRSRLQPKLLKDFEEIDISSYEDGIGVANALAAMLGETVCEVEFVYSDGSRIGRRLLTKNKEILPKFLGKDWEIKFGSKDDKLNYILRNEFDFSPKSAVQALSEAGFAKELVTVGGIFEEKGVIAGVEAVRAAMTRRSFTPNPENVTAFDVNALDDRTFFVTIKGGNILSIKKAIG